MDNPERTVERTVRWLKTKKSLPKGTRKATSEKHYVFILIQKNTKVKSYLILRKKEKQWQEISS